MQADLQASGQHVVLDGHSMLASTGQNRVVASPTLTTSRLKQAMPTNVDKALFELCFSSVATWNNLKVQKRVPFGLGTTIVRSERLMESRSKADELLMSTAVSCNTDAQNWPHNANNPRCLVKATSSRVARTHCEFPPEQRLPKCVHVQQSK
eukprot:5671082-Amphidinium_carterae.1